MNTAVQSTESDLLKVKEKLNKDKVKLWLSPFFTDKDGINENEIKNLASSYSSQLSMPVENCIECLFRLQEKALDNVKEKKMYQETGIAALKVKVPNKGRICNVITVRMDLLKSGILLKEAISKEISIPVERLKIIIQGKILKDEENLISQGVKHGLHVMAIVLEDNFNDFLLNKNHNSVLDSFKADVKVLTGKNVDKNYLQVTDQSGKLLKFPYKESQALILAMTLHEKGRWAMKNENFAFALVLLLEAEKEFSMCNSDFLKNVDNYGLLNLDIVWCYLNLESVVHLPNAEERLRQCEMNFEQSYGPNLERLTALKGFHENEKVLFMRLHLLQAIVCYHQNNIAESRLLLNKAEQELKLLQVDDSKLSQLLELGYETTEARLALRETMGDVNSAVDVIERKRQCREKNKEAEEKERNQKKKLGKCMNGDWIEPDSHSLLMAMGYSYETARWALAQCNNNKCDAVNLIEEHPEFLNLTDSSVEQVTDAKFVSEFDKFGNKKYSESNNDEFTDGSSEKKSSSLDSDNGGPSTSGKNYEEAFSRVSEGISNSEEDHLDFNLVAETFYVQKYKDLVSER